MALSCCSRSKITSPRFPSELAELVVEELRDSQPNLFSCSLVCSEWLAFARSHVPISLTAQNIAVFIQLLHSPRATLFSTIRQLHISMGDHDHGVHLPLLQLLPRFTRMRSLDMSCKFSDDLPSIPQLTELRLNGEFGTYAGYVRFLSDLPALQSLRLDGFFWKDCPRSPPLVVPFPFLDLNISKYLHHLGVHLQYLHLNCEFVDHIGSAAGFDFSQSSGLRHLRIGSAIHFHRTIMLVPPQLEGLLAGVTPHCRLETLILNVHTNDIGFPPRWMPLSQFAQLVLDIPPSATVREIQFILDGPASCLDAYKISARSVLERFEALLPAILPSIPTRRVVCIEGEEVIDY
ncbi:hypothetical protein C8R47DRAFT_1218773 [Mycena vitilis]|nr:hypothetical protein C8R47DRAFT_1218773 [Mycena vitilis]